MTRRTLTAKEAAKLLGIKETTLYAYVSRGMIRSVEGEATNSRARRYLAEDVHALMKRQTHRRDPSSVAEDALNWGTPVLESALTRIEDGKLYYRGRNAAELAQTASFEEVAELLWGVPWPVGAQPKSLSRVRQGGKVRFPSLYDLQARLADAAHDDMRAYSLTPERVAVTGARILYLMTEALIAGPVSGGISESLVRAWNGDARLFDAALILCSDHELNASSFTARVVASTEANPYAVVIAGLSALHGVKHGGMTLRVGAFLNDVRDSTQVAQAVSARIQRGDYVPGFGHMLYPDGDPRYAVLMNLLRQRYDGSPRFQLCETVARAGENATGLKPTVDFALASLAYTLSMPPEMALALFALGRTAGWIAHAMEQYRDGRLIRPRATYVGE